MKTNHIIVFILFCSLNLLVHADWYTQYKRGIIVIKPDVSFATKTAWEDILFNDVHDIAVATQGTIFMTNGHNHNYFIISATGELQKTVSQRGEGPIDLYAPSKPVLVDNKYLVITEYPECNRMAVYNLSEKFVKKIRTQHSPFGTVALKNNKIAYYSQKLISAESSAKQLVQYSVHIKDIQNGTEKMVYTIAIMSRKNPDSKIQIGVFDYNIFIAASLDGQLLVGTSNLNRIDMYTEQGLKVKSFDLKLNPVPLTSDLIEKHEKFMKKQIANDLPQSQRDRFLPLIKKVDFEDFAGPTLPLYSNITVDSDGNILLFLYPTDPELKNKTFQVYSKDGIFLCTCQLNLGRFESTAGRSRRSLLFTKDGIIGIFKTETEDDTIYKLMRVKRQ